MKFSESLRGVIDLRRGRAVHAVAGQRSVYREAVVDECELGSTLDIVRRYQRLGLSSVYVADLDAILDNAPNVGLLSEIVELVPDVWIDAGGAAAGLAMQFGESQVRFVLPTECVATVDQWSQLCQVIGGGERVVLGLDLAGVQVRTSAEVNRAACVDELINAALSWIEAAVTHGVASVLALDLQHVGRMQGPGIAQTCAHLVNRWPRLQWASGGGVRDADDVRCLLDAGCTSVLVGTALHRNETAKRMRVGGSGYC